MTVTDSELDEMLKLRGGHQKVAKHYRDLLKDAGVELPGDARTYRHPELKQLWELLQQYGPEAVMEALADTGEDAMPTSPGSPIPPPKPQEVRRAPAQTAAVDAYKEDYDEKVLFTDSNGLKWFREEVRKPASPAPRKRRRITYVDSGVKTEKAVNGRYVETVEVAGDRRQTADVRITMPSWQVGVYLDPRFPFKVHIYNNVRGFNLFDVQKFYGGSDMVPESILRRYVGNDLCYDIQTTIREIQAEFRRLQLKESR